MHAVLRAKRILIQLHTTGNMKHLMRQWKELVGAFLDPLTGEMKMNPVLVLPFLAPFLSRKVELECVCAEILRNSSSLPWSKAEDRAQILLRTLPRLEALLCQLLATERSCLATRVARTYLSMHAKSRGPFPVIERLLLMTTLEPHDKMNIYLDLARKMNAVQAHHLGDAYLAKAEELFQTTGNPIGAMEVKLIVLTRPNKDSNDDAAQLWSLKEQFSQLKYRVHEFLVLRTLAKFDRDTANNSRGNLTTILAKQQRLAYEIGSRLFWTLTLQVYVPHVCYSDEGALSHVLENENILNPKLIIPIPQIKFALCKVIALNYGKMGKVIQELHWAALTLRYAREAGARTDISQATCLYLQAMAKIPIPNKNSRREPVVF